MFCFLSDEILESSTLFWDDKIGIVVMILHICVTVCVLFSLFMLNFPLMASGKSEGNWWDVLGLCSLAEQIIEANYLHLFVDMLLCFIFFYTYKQNLFHNYYWYWAFLLYKWVKPVQVGVVPKHNPEMDQKKRARVFHCLLPSETFGSLQILQWILSFPNQ